jgi:DNA helicase-2/ATP-dependent DNA helicase PcrA|tara:strand:+ start:1909 stop:3420 length:1512 start_codon:yes stop_codon:yes gene_type:complete
MESKTIKIFGSPGTGKTTTLLKLLEEKISEGFKPEKIGFVSFTRRAVREARSRVIKKFNLSEDDLEYFRTIHSLCYRTLNINSGQVFKGERVKEFSELARIEMSGVSEEDNSGLAVGSKKGDLLLFCDEVSRSSERSLKEIWKELECDHTWEEQEYFSKVLINFKKSKNLLDFTDMLDVFIKEETIPQLDILFVDEAQDLTTKQWRVIEKLNQHCKFRYIAGDDDQAIYRWAGADVKKFLNIKGNVEVLPISYRLPKTIHKLACDISHKISLRQVKKWTSREDQGSITDISSIEDVDMSDGEWLILARSGYQLFKAESYCKRMGWFYEKGHHEFKTNKFVIAIRSWIKLNRGETISFDELKKLYQCIRSKTGIKRGFKKLEGVDQNVEFSLQNLRDDVGLIAEGDWQEVIFGLDPEDILMFESLIKSGDIFKNKARIRLSTIHGIKGGESDNVVVISDISYKTWKKFNIEPDDEHRVFYVAVTRAKKNLFLLQPETKYSYELR